MNLKFSDIFELAKSQNCSIGNNRELFEKMRKNAINPFELAKKKI